MVNINDSEQQFPQPPIRYITEIGNGYVKYNDGTRASHSEETRRDVARQLAWSKVAPTATQNTQVDEAIFSVLEEQRNPYGFPIQSIFLYSDKDFKKTNREVREYCFNNPSFSRTIDFVLTFVRDSVLKWLANKFRFLKNENNVFFLLRERKYSNHLYVLSSRNEQNYMHYKTSQKKLVDRGQEFGAEDKPLTLTTNLR